MDDRQLDVLADGWIAATMAHMRSMAGSVESLEPLWWAMERTGDLIEASPDEGLRLVCRILERCDGRDQTLSVLAAGPLEQLLVEHGPAIIARVEDEARRSPSFAALLGGVWQGDMPPAVWARVQAVWDRSGRHGIPKDSWLH